MNLKLIAMLLGVLVVYEGLVYYLWKSFYWMISPFVPTNAKTIIAVIFFIIANLSIIAYLLKLGAPYTNYTNIWFFYFLYGLILVVVLTIIKLILKYFGIELSQGVVLVVTSTTLIGLTIFGLTYAYSPVVKESTVKIDKPLDEPMKIAVVSDLHLGTFFGNNQLDKLNAIVKEHQPDAVIIAGDIMDDDMVMYKKLDMGKHLEAIKTEYGTYVTMGNHDNDAQAIVDEVRKSGVNTLLDESITLSNGVTLVGRKDNTDKNRAKTVDLLKDVDTTNPVILIDHQPTDINTHKDLDIDIQLSGHTHHGQLWPLNYITSRMYVLDYGYANINGRHFFTSAGYGFWGPPFKTTARSEVLLITIEGK